MMLARGKGKAIALILPIVALNVMITLMITDNKLIRHSGGRDTAFVHGEVELKTITQQQDTFQQEDSGTLNKELNSFNYSQPSTINYTALAFELKLGKVFEMRFKSPSPSNTTIPPWCSLNGKRKKTWKEGLLYNKVPKTASSTTVGVLLRIAHQVSARFSLKEPCHMHHNHLHNSGMPKELFGVRDKNKSFLFGTVREPGKRAVSHIFYEEISNKNHSATDENMMKFLQNTDRRNGVVSKGQGGYQVEYLTLQHIREYSAWKPETPTHVVNPEMIHNSVRRVLYDYDFFASVERYDESLVVMQLLLNLTASDILYLSTKQAGSSYRADSSRGGRFCIFLQKSFASKAVSEYLTSDEWYAKQYGDYLLQEAVSQSLDLTIEALGRDVFQNALNDYLSLKSRANLECADKAHFPCSNEGKPQRKLARASCYRGDKGCGYRCLDQLNTTG